MIDVLTNTCRLLDYCQLDCSIENLDIGFSYNIEKGMQIDQLALMERIL